MFESWSITIQFGFSFQSLASRSIFAGIAYRTIAVTRLDVFFHPLDTEQANAILGEVESHWSFTRPGPNYRQSVVLDNSDGIRRR